MSGNTPRVGRSSQARKPDFWYFDRLPPTARRALADAAFDWSSASFYNKWRRAVRGYKTGADVAKRVSEADARTITKENAAKYK